MSVIPLHAGGRAPGVVRERAVRLFKFLREYTLLRTRSIRTTESYEEVIWLSGVPQRPGCHSAAFDAGEKETEVWIEVVQPRLEPPPSPPDLLRPWLKADGLRDSAQDAPPLFEAIQIAGEPGIAGEPLRWVAFEEQPDVSRAYDDYVERSWWPWAERDRPLRRQQQVYTELFRLHQSQQRLGEAYEVVMGLGHLVWRTPSGVTVQRHLVVAQTDVRFDADAGVITVVAAVDGARPAIEHDMLEPGERPAADELDRIASTLAEVGDDIFGEQAVRRALRAWVHAASSRGRYEDDLARQPEVSDAPVVHFAPALILRKRTERSIVQALEAIVEHLQQEGAHVPAGVRQLVGIVEDGSSGDEHRGPSGPHVEEILFPLPANEEQLDIARRLGERPGVLVQGPPGTGKSHTIANLIAHLLAAGQRVLVTSHTARALQVLREKVPAEVRELAVVVLGNDVTGREELRASVMGIQRRHSSWNRRRAGEAVASLRRQLGQAREAEATVLGQLRALRESDSHRHPPRPGGYEGTAQEIASELRRRAADHGWIAGQVDAERGCPLSPEETRELRGLLRELGRVAAADLWLAVPEMAGVATPAAFAAMVEAERAAAAAGAEVERFRDGAAYPALRACPDGARNALWSAAHELAQAREALDQRPEPWVAAAVGQVLLGYSSRWHDLERYTQEALDVIRPRLAAVGHAQVTGLQGREAAAVLGDSRPLLEHLRQGRGRGAGPFRPAVVKRAQYVADEVRVDGVSCRDVDALDRLVTWLEVQARLDGLDAEWDAILVVPAGSAGARAAGYADVLASLRSVLLMESRAAAVARAAAEVPALALPDWSDPAALRGLVGAAAAAHRDVARADARASFTATEAALMAAAAIGSGAHPAVDAALDALYGRDAELYSQAYQALAAAAQLRGHGRRRDALVARLGEAAPGVAASLLGGEDGSDPDGRLADLHAAWDWAQADAWLRSLADPGEMRRLERRLDEARQDIERVTRKLTAELAWSQTMSRLTEAERQHLVAWENAVRKIGKGTGKMAPVWRARAREAMEGCRTAVPAWIMPIFKIAETVDIVPEAFDVVIVDEASQSGPEALFLQFLARKVIVVGDDQQISPSNIGIERDKVELLNAQYLKDIPLGSFFNADNSMFDLAAIRYRDRVMLREHFRCMPEIIQFSNRLCYRDQPLIPLRQFGADRLAPVVQVRHLPEGCVTNDNVNEAEANAIVDQVVACLRDPAYDGKTFGVLSLVGQAQAEHVRRLLVQRVDPAELERRQIVCGDAYAFQGDERDVMFLSLVQAPRDGRKVAALTRDADKRRFNVAASRARDQMWLFHTATMNDMHPESVARELLDHCLHPGLERTPLRDVGLDVLRRRAGAHERGERPPAPFDSWFEAEVFLRLAERGHRVIPQYPMADYSIDLVVEGQHGRLAVECDGDVWHGAEAFDRDAYRQRMLERCGMRFVRVRGSAFYRDPDAALAPLWAELRAHGITAPGEEPAAVEPPGVVAPPADLEIVTDGRAAGGPSEPAGSESEPRPPERDYPAPPKTDGDETSESRDADPEMEDWARPYQVARPTPPRVTVDMHLPGADLDVRRMVQEVVDVEGPIAPELLVRRVRDAWGLERAGSRVAEAVRRQLGQLSERGRLRVVDGFVWARDVRVTYVRVPTRDPATVRDADQVPPAEIDLAIRRTVMRAGVMERGDLVRATARLFGWKRLGTDIAPTLSARVDELVRLERLVEKGGQVRLAVGRDEAPTVEPVRPERVAVSPSPPVTERAPAIPVDLHRCLTERGWRDREAEVKRLEARLEHARREADAPAVERLSKEVSDLRGLLENAHVLARPRDDARALLGCRVEFRENGGPAEVWLLVPPAEADASRGRLDVGTPFGRALFGRRVGDRVEVARPDGRRVIEIMAIEVD